ncbi:MAG TPA: hypothetical protein VJW94_00530 [Candidatus Acidoferrum sp.]|nr:hypothetical protein [Candidatus Acidoferrum sp.]
MFILKGLQVNITLRGHCCFKASDGMQNESAVEVDKMREEETAGLCRARHSVKDPLYAHLKEIKSAQPEMAGTTDRTLK